MVPGRPQLRDHIGLDEDGIPRRWGPTRHRLDVRSEPFPASQLEDRVPEDPVTPAKRFRALPTDAPLSVAKRPMVRKAPANARHAQLLHLLHDHEQDIEVGLENAPARVGSIITHRSMQVGRPAAKGYHQGQGIKDAYATPAGMQAHGPTFYLAGTRFNHQEDIEDDIKLVIPGQGVRATTKYQKAAAYIRSHPEIKMVVGHSLGAAVADALVQDFPYLKEMAYGDPMPTYIMGKGHHRNWGDLVSIADFRTNMAFPSNWNAHDYFDEASRYGNEEYDNQ